MKFLCIILILAIGLSSCNAIKKAIDEKRTGKAKLQFDRHPDTAAHYCAVHFPVKDSMAPDIYHPADNVDYTSLIDSILKSSDSLSKDSIVGAWIKAIDWATSDVASSFQSVLTKKQDQINDLQKSIMHLHYSYKPCKPDTVLQEHFTVDGAAVADANDISQREKASRIKTESENAKLKSRLNWWKIACLITWAIVAIYLTIVIVKPKI
jgi:hypothetical protein